MQSVGDLQCPDLGQSAWETGGLRRRCPRPDCMATPPCMAFVIIGRGRRCRPQPSQWIKSICNVYNFNLIIESCEKSGKNDYFDRISRRCEIAACRHLRALRRQLSVAIFALTFSLVPLRLKSKFRAESVGVLMYFHMVYSQECSPVGSERKSTRKLFRQATELMVTMEHEFVGRSTSPPFALL